jgi:hypothetical protein
MLRIVLPLTAACLTSITSIDVGDVILVEVVLVIDVDVATVVPIAIAPVAAGPGTQRKSGRAPRQPHAGVVPWIGIRIIRVSWRRGPVDHRRIVRRYVHYVLLSRLHHNHLFATFHRPGLDCLLRARLQISRALSLSSHPLDRLHHIGLLRQKRVAQIGRPLDIPGQSLDNVRSCRQRLHAWVPCLFGDGVRQCLVFQVFIPIHPLLKLNDLQRIRRSGQRLRKQRI